MQVPATERCAFCDYLSGARDCAFVTRRDTLSSFANLRQYERGSLLVVPNVHRGTVLDLGADLIAAIHNEAALLARALVTAFGATGVNIFQNNGVSAGQSEPHFHVHVVARYAGNDPRRVFNSRDVAPAPFSEQLEVAAAVRRALDGLHS